MNLKIHHPRLLVAVLLVVLGLSSATVLFADDLNLGQKAKGVFPAIPVSQQVTPEEQEKAVKIVKDSGVVELVSGNQEWTASDGFGKKVGGNTVAKLYASWENAATSSGPWIDAECQGTRITVVSAEISNIKKLALWVDIEDENVVAYVPGAADPGEAGPVEPPLTDDLKVRVYDAKSGEELYDGIYGNLDKLCPAGSEDD